jgi:hypothetical protein
MANVTKQMTALVLNQPMIPRMIGSSLKTD